MPSTRFLCNVVAILFLLAGGLLFGLRSNYDPWVPIVAATLAGAVAAEAIGLVLTRRGQAAAAD